MKKIIFAYYRQKLKAKEMSGIEHISGVVTGTISVPPGIIGSLAMLVPVLVNIGSDIKLIRQELHISNCETQEEKDDLRAYFEQDRLTKMKQTLMVMGVAGIAVVAFNIIKRS